jgi:hypothetical protein
MEATQENTSTEQETPENTTREDGPTPDQREAGKALSKLGASRGGKARAERLSPEARSEQARKAVSARWAKKGKTVAKAVPAGHETAPLPVAEYKGFLDIMDVELPCYVLDTGQRVIGRVAATEMLSGFKYQGDLEGYIRSQNLRPFIDKDSVVERMVSFRLPEVEQLGRESKGLPADLMIEVCSGLVRALEASHRGEVKLTPRQISMAIKSSMFLTACAKVGLDALIDEATGYQYKRDEDALQVKLRAYLLKEMRKWEKTFPEELWIEFARLTNWHGSVTSRPKYWGQLVMKLVYEYLDPDVAKWLRENAPKPQKGQNYHLWLTEQYGLKKLVEHIWMLVGIAKTCPDGGINELKAKMERMFGKGKMQMELLFQRPQQALPPAPPSPQGSIFDAIESPAEAAQ